MITIAAMQISAGWQWELRGTKECATVDDALAYINAEAAAWFEEGRATAKECGGVWEGSLPVITSLRYTPEIECNGGEEAFMAVLDAKSQRAIYSATRAEWEKEHGGKR